VAGLLTDGEIMIRIEDTTFWHLVFWALVVLGVLVFVSVFRDILLPFILGGLLAYLLNPIADRLERMGLGRLEASGLIISGLGLVVGVASVLLVPLAAAQAQALVAALPSDWARLIAELETFAAQALGAHFPAARASVTKALDALQSHVSASAGTVVTTVLDRGRAMFGIVSVVLITPLVAFYLLRDWHRMIEVIDTWLPRAEAPTIRRLAREIDDSVAAFVRGQALICALLGALYAIGLSLLGLRYGLVVGIATGVLAFVPAIGWVVGTLTAVGLALSQFGWMVWPLAGVIGLMLAGLVIDTAVLSPRLVGERLGLHPVWLIFALFAASVVFGLVGTLIAVPLAAAIRILARDALDAYQRSELYRGS
jgi:predicted PurR-regulated permease PerM